jgi:hypothetical protein
MILAKAGAGIRFNEDMEGDCETVFRDECNSALKVSCRSGFLLPLWPLAPLAQNEERRSPTVKQSVAIWSMQSAMSRRHQQGPASPDGFRP